MAPLDTGVLVILCLDGKALWGTKSYCLAFAGSGDLEVTATAERELGATMQPRWNSALRYSRAGARS